MSKSVCARNSYLQRYSVSLDLPLLSPSSVQASSALSTRRSTEATQRSISAGSYSGSTLSLLSVSIIHRRDLGSHHQLEVVTLTVAIILDSAFIIACIVSFRTLFIHKEQQQSDAKNEENKHQQVADQMQRRKSFLKRMHRLRDSVLDTCRTWEGTWNGSDMSLLRTFRLPQPPSARLSVDFSSDDGTSFSQSASKNSGDSSPGIKMSV